MNNQFTYEMEAAIAGWKTLRTEQNKNAGYIYRMTRDVPGHEPGGTFHSGEHMYIFRTLNRSWRPFNGNDYDLSRKMCDYWCNFVKTGNPNGEGLPEWGRYTEDSKNVMKLDVKCACVPYEDCEIVKLISRCELGR